LHKIAELNQSNLKGRNPRIWSHAIWPKLQKAFLFFLILQNAFPKSPAGKDIFFFSSYFQENLRARKIKFYGTPLAKGSSGRRGTLRSSP
jgi:hypothetical protein